MDRIVGTLGQLLQIIALGPLTWIGFTAGLHLGSTAILFWGVILIPGILALTGMGLSFWGGRKKP